MSAKVFGLSRCPMKGPDPSPSNRSRYKQVEACAAKYMPGHCNEPGRSRVPDQSRITSHRERASWNVGKSSKQWRFRGLWQGGGGARPTAENPAQAFGLVTAPTLAGGDLDPV